MTGRKGRYLCIALVLVTTALMFSGCSTSNVKASEESNIKAVKAQLIKKESYSYALDYTGYVASKDAKNYSFESGGKVKEVFVKEGESVTKGQKLAQLDPSDIQFQVDNAKQNVVLMNSAIAQSENSVEKMQLSLETEKINLKKLEDTYESNIEKLSNTYELKKKSYERTKSLYDAGGASLQDLENAKASYDTAKEDLENTKKDKVNDIDLEKLNISNLEKQLEVAHLNLQDTYAKLEQSNITLAKNMKALNNSILTATMDGIVSDVAVKSDEMIGAGSPIVSVTSKEQMINISVPVEEYPKIQKEADVSIEVSGETFKGKIHKISLYPDQATRTYNVQIIPQKSGLVLASLANVKIPIEEKEGYFIPISSIMNINDVNYIYALEKDDHNGYYHINPIEVILGEINGERVLAQNITSDMTIITEGVKDIKESDIVQIVE